MTHDMTFVHKQVTHRHFFFMSVHSISSILMCMKYFSRRPIIICQYLYWFEYSDIRSTWFVKNIPCNRINNIISYNDLAINNAHGFNIIVSLYSWNCSKLNTTSWQEIKNVGTCEWFDVICDTGRMYWLNQIDISSEYLWYSLYS